MRRPTRTGRLSITAILSLLALVAVAGIGVRSFWFQESWTLQPASTGRVAERMIALNRGRVSCEDVSWITATKPSELRDLGYMSGDLKSPFPGHRSILGLSETKEVALILKDRTLVILVVDVPLWPLLVLLLIAPLRWLIARPAGGPAFPVVIDSKSNCAT